MHSSFPAIAFFGFTGMMLLIPLILFVVWIAILLWVAQDAKEHGESAALWVLVVFFLHLLGLIIYLLVRGPRRGPD